MKPRIPNQRTAALTLVEVVVIIAVLFVLVVLILPAFSNARRQDPRWHQCIQNLKEIGLAYKVWAGDHNDKFPMQVSVADGGTMELTAGGKYPWLNFLAMSNELDSPKLLVCPADEGRVAARDWTTSLSAKNVSYFVGLDAIPKHPQMFLSGDDNFAMGGVVVKYGQLEILTNAHVGGVPVKSGLLELSTNAPITWTAKRHDKAGNIGLADGSVAQTTQSLLHQMLVQTGVATNRLAIP